MPDDKHFKEILAGIKFAKTKGCPIESVWIAPDVHDELSYLAGGMPIDEIQGHPVHVIRRPYPWSINLACGWTSDKGDERHTIIPSDIQQDVTPPPRIDTTPMETSPLWASFG